LIVIAKCAYGNKNAEVPSLLYTHHTKDKDFYISNGFKT